MRRVDGQGNMTRYQTYDAQGLPSKRVDFVGAAHGSVSTPHVVEYTRHTNPSTGEVFLRPERPRPAEPDELPWERAMLDSPTRPFVPLRLTAITPEAAAELARLLHPDLIEVRGCVLLPWAYEAANFESWWERLNGDRARIEGVLNHLHLWDVFDADVDEAKLREMAEIIATGWRAAARVDFPERSFDVVVSFDDDDYGPTVHTSSTDLAGVAGSPRRKEGVEGVRPASNVSGGERETINCVWCPWKPRSWFEAKHVFTRKHADLTRCRGCTRVPITWRLYT